MSAGHAFIVRQATVGDAAAIAAQRAAMFAEMGELAVSRVPDLVRRATHYLEAAIASGEYTGFLASPSGEDGVIIGGAGAQVRRTLPHPREPDGTPHGTQAIVLNVYTDPAWRGHGVAELLMQRVIRWAGEAGMDTLVLHASTAGRPLYEKLGFAATSEMRYAGTLRGPAAPSAAKEGT